MRVFLHIGLHKTATTLLQQRVFPNLQGEISYNPPAINTPLRETFRHTYFTGDRRDYFHRALKTLKETVASFSTLKNDKILLLSHEGMSQLNFLQNYEEHADLLHQIFPNAEIILFLRFQPDWLLSIYKQTVATGEHQSVDQFLNFRDGEFQPTDSIYNAAGLLHIDALKSNWIGLLRLYLDRFGRENVHVFFYEAFRDGKWKTLNDLTNILDATLPDLSLDELVNPSVSALTCRLLEYRFRLFNKVGLNWLCHTVEKDRERYYKKVSDNFWRRPKLLTRRPLIQDAIERFFYKDWDLLERHGMRNKLTQYYRNQNRELVESLPKEKIPPNYLNFT